VNEDFGVSKVAILGLQTRNVENRQKIRSYGTVSVVEQRSLANTKTIRRGIGR